MAKIWVKMKKGLFLLFNRRIDTTEKQPVVQQKSCPIIKEEKSVKILPSGTSVKTVKLTKIKGACDKSTQPTDNCSDKSTQSKVEKLKEMHKKGDIAKGVSQLKKGAVK